MPTADLTAPNGWKKWVHPVTTISSVQSNTGSTTITTAVVPDIQLPDTSFPPLYTPASAFWLKSDMTHCLIPWINVMDFISQFYLGGGFSGTIMGSLGGLDVVRQLFNISFATATFGLNGNGPGPRFGFCIGDRFKQEAYIKFMIQNTPGQVLLLGKSVEMTENGRFKRLYISYGEVVNCVISDTGNILTLDINKTLSPPSDLISSIIGTKITIQKSDGTSFVISVLGLKDNWDLIVSTALDIKNIPTNGDYYKLDTMWCIEDPYLLTGFWQGTENDTTPLTASSGYDLFLTDQNKPYQEGKILGVYIWKIKPSTTPSTTSPSVYQPTIGSSMSNSTDYQWTFYGNGNSADYSDTYPNDTRYQEVRLDVPDPVTGATVQYEIMPTSTSSDLVLLLANPSTTYLRIEINTGGYYDRNNWHSPCLYGSCLEIAGKLYKILAHVGANIIDVALKSIDGSSTLDINNNQNYSIFNQSAWMVSEYYFQDISSTANTGLLEGNISSIDAKTKTIIIKTLPIPSDALLKKDGVSIIDRCTTEVSLPSSMKKLYKKQQSWMLVSSTNEYMIDNVIFGDIGTDNTYTMTVVLKNIPADLIVNQRVYISTDVPYETVYPFSKRGGASLELTVGGGINKGGSYITSDVLCLDGEYKPAPYAIDIEPDIRIGICDGLYCGISANGSAQDRMGVLIFATVPRIANGVASLFHALREEDWVVYQDVNTKKITIRKGSLNFKEYPCKDEVVIGKPKFILPASVSGGGSEVILDSTKERLRRIMFNVQNLDDIPAITFGIGSTTNAYGFLVSGKGLVDLQMLRYQGIDPGVISSYEYVDVDGQPVSPVYTYKLSSVQNLKTTYVDIGADTTQNVFINDGTVSSVVAQYIYDNQVLTNQGLFDVIKLSDGEVIILYGQSVKPFNLYNDDRSSFNLNNDSTNDTKWFNSNAVFMIGSFNDTYFWGTPYKIKNGSDDDNKFQYPIMMLNSVEYVGCIYNSRVNTICIFVRAFRGNTSYLGCFKVALSTLTHLLYECEDKNYTPATASSSSLGFLFRPPLISDSVIANPNTSWIHGSTDIIKDFYSFDSSTENVIGDNYINVISSIGQVKYGDEFGIISTNILPDGTYVVFYDTNSGVRAVYSPDQGNTWVTSYLIYSRQGRCGLMVGDRFFYITSSGIEVKFVYMADFYDDKEISMKRAEGIDVTTIEINKQTYIDTLTTLPIGSGVIEYQRLSGYISPEGITKIFFYDTNGRLKCMESSDSRTWIVADNF